MNFVMKSTIVVSGMAVAGLALFLAVREGSEPARQGADESSPAAAARHSAAARATVSFVSTSRRVDRPDPVSNVTSDDQPFAGRTSGRLVGAKASESEQEEAPPGDHPAAQSDERLAGTDADSPSRPAVSAPIRHAAELRKQLFEDAQRVDEESGNAVFLRPAIWVDLGDDSQFPVGHSPSIQAEAEELQTKISESGIDPSSAEYRRFWNQSVRESDWKFRARYGARLWSKHHVQSYHLSTNQEE
jgi:hypothetical protein